MSLAQMTTKSALLTTCMYYALLTGQWRSLSHLHPRLYINTLGLSGDIGGDQEGGGDPTVSMGSGRRKKRSTMKRTLTKRQDVAPVEQEISENVTLVRIMMSYKNHRSLSSDVLVTTK